MQAPAAVEVWDTGLEPSLLRFIGEGSVSAPPAFVCPPLFPRPGRVESAFLQSVHPHLAKAHCGVRKAKLAAGDPLDWGTAEALALGSLLLQGPPASRDK